MVSLRWTVALICLLLPGLLRAEGVRLGLGRLLLVYFEGAFFNLFLPRHVR